MTRPRLGTSRATALVLLASTLTLGLAFLLKDSCNDLSWDGSQYRSLCYNDIAPLYSLRHLDADTLPYTRHDADDPTDLDLTHRQGFLEYPALTGLFLWAAARLGTLRAAAFGGDESFVEFFYWNAALLAVCALATALVLARMATPRRRAAYFAAGSPLLLYAFHNWDLLAVSLAVVGLYAWERGRPFGAGLALGLGASAKLYPILIPPLLFVAAVRARYTAPARRTLAPAAVLVAAARAAPAWRMAAGVVAALLAVNLPFLLWGDADLFLETFRFHARRLPNIETVWFATEYFSRRWGLGSPHLLTSPRAFAAGAIAFAALAYGAVAVLLWRRRLDVRAASLAAVLVMLLANKIFSVQYALWVLPFFALVRLPAWAYAAYAAADAWVYATLFPTLAAIGPTRTLAALVANDAFADRYRWSALAVFARTATLVVLLVVALRRGMRPRAALQAAGAGARITSGPGGRRGGPRSPGRS